MNPPPYPSDTKAKGWRFELDIEQVMQSDTWAVASPELRPWLLMIWTISWQQVPCGSLPDDDEIIAARIGMKLAQFAKNKSILLRGWKLADDGRLYHPTITQRVLEKLKNKDKYRKFRHDILIRDGYRCAYCGAENIPLELDHIIPRSRGGSDNPENLTLACKPCNSSKGAKNLNEWMDGK